MGTLNFSSYCKSQRIYQFAYNVNNRLQECIIMICIVPCRYPYAIRDLYPKKEVDDNCRFESIVIGSDDLHNYIN